MGWKLQVLGDLQPRLQALGRGLLVAAVDVSSQLVLLVGGIPVPADAQNESQAAGDASLACLEQYS